MKIQKFNEAKINYTPTSLLNIIDEVDDLKNIIFQYFCEKNGIDIEDDYIRERNITTVNDKVVLWYDDESEINASAFIDDINDLILFINENKLKQDTKKYNL